MRLLHTTSMNLVEFLTESRPPYAILSHTWGSDEVLFDDVRGGTATASRKAGFAKVQGCCRKARGDGFDWVWIDSCCINKESSAELSEAINSMYAWYRDSLVCYVYLHDVSARTTAPPPPPPPPSLHAPATDPSTSAEPVFPVQDLGSSRWFRRGWTLQELLAPRVVEFYTRDWDEIGPRDAMATQISRITNVAVDALLGKPLGQYLVAEKMSWAAHRQTTRLEDTAYCLLGIFDINMPLLYGEGDRAFRRLQIEILRSVEDYSILAWTMGRALAHVMTSSLALSPADFAPNVGDRFWAPVRSMKPAAAVESLGKFARMHPGVNLLPGSQPAKAGEVARPFISGDWIPEGSLLGSRKNYFDMDLFMPDTWAPGPVSSTEWGPPEPTNRGIRVCLPVWQVGAEKGPILAFLWCSYSRDTIVPGILLHQFGHRPGVYARCASSYLVGIQKDDLASFVMRQIYLYDKQIPLEAEPIRLNPVNVAKESLGQASFCHVDIKQPDSNGLGVVHITTKGDSGLRSPRVDGAAPGVYRVIDCEYRGDQDRAAISCTYLLPERPTFRPRSRASWLRQKLLRFAVAIGVRDKSPWCQIKLQDGFRPDPAKDVLDDISSWNLLSPQHLGSLRGRDAVCLTGKGLPQRVYLTAAIRRGCRSSTDGPAFMLAIKTARWVTDTWATELCRSEVLTDSMVLTKRDEERIRAQQTAASYLAQKKTGM